MPSLLTLQGIDETLANLELKQGTLKAELARVIRSYFADDHSLQSISSIPTEAIVGKIWGDYQDGGLKAKKKNLSRLKSALNKSLKDLDKAGKNQAGIILGRDNVFTVSEERKDELLNQLGLAPNSPHLLHDLFAAFNRFISENVKEASAQGIGELLAEFEEAQKKLRKMAGLEPESNTEESGAESAWTGEGDEKAEVLEPIELLDGDAVEVIEVSEILAEEELEEILVEESSSGQGLGAEETGLAEAGVAKELEILDEEQIEEVAEEVLEDAEILDEEVEILEEEEWEEVPAEPLAETPGQPAPLNVLSKYLDPEEAVRQGELLRETQEEFINQLLERCMPKFIKIPAGLYMVGSVSPKGLEQPLRQVRLPDFYLGQAPVTNDLFEMFVRETGYVTEAEEAEYGTVFEGRCTSRRDPDTGREILSLNQTTVARQVSGANWRHPGGVDSSLEGKHNHPVVQVSHTDAMAFAAWAGKRLPTEEEWEAAARGPSGQPFPWGDSWLAELGNLEGACLGGTTSVEHFGRQGMSPFGIHDLLGNTAEWTASLHADQAEPQPGRSAERIYILKGGSWITGGTVTATWRQIEGGRYWANTIGFRCAV